ncbi:MAG: hypothetical protein ACTSR8_08970 [Promethearchaeota archaeon]
MMIIKKIAPVFFFFISIIIAIPPSTAELDIGVKADEEIFWEIQINKDNLNDFEKDFDPNETYSINPDLQGIKIKIISISKEEDSYTDCRIEYYESTDFQNNNWKLSADKEDLRIHEYDADYYSSSTMVLNLIFGKVLALPKDMNWEKVAEKIEYNLNLDTSIEQYRVKAKDNSINLSITYETLEKLEAELIYNEDGILEFYKLRYNDDKVMEMVYVAIYLPFSFMIIVIIIIISILLGLIFFIRYRGISLPKRKKRASKEASIPKEKKERKLKKTFSSGWPKKKGKSNSSGIIKLELGKTVQDEDVPVSIRQFILNSNSKAGDITAKYIPSNLTRQGIRKIKYKIQEKKITISLYNENKEQILSHEVNEYGLPGSVKKILTAGEQTLILEGKKIPDRYKDDNPEASFCKIKVVPKKITAYYYKKIQ